MNEEADRVLANKSNIWLIGMKAMDARVIRNYILLVKDLNSEFKLIADADAKAADIVFVNVDSREACETYKSHVRQSRTKPIVVKCSCRETAARNKSHLVQPVSRKALESLLKKITSTNRSRSFNTSQDELGHDLVKILVVDDSFPVRKYMEEKLPVLTQSISGDIQLNINFASSGQESVKSIKDAKGDYDIIFLDVVMDDVDGYKICKWIKSVKDDIQVIMLTSKNSTFDKVRGKIAGCNGYLSKPPTDQDLKNVLIHALELKLRKNNPVSLKTHVGN